MNVFDFLSPHLPTSWSVKHKIDAVETDLGQATSKPIISTQPALIWTFTENAVISNVRLTLLDQHGSVKIEVNGTAKQNAGANGGVGNMGGASAILKCTYTDSGQNHEYRFEGTLLNIPFV